MRYCPNCGVELSQALSYCNRCGAQLAASLDHAKPGSIETTTDTLVWVIVGTTITLLGMSLGAMVLMKNGSIDATLGKAFVILSFAAFVLVEGVLIWRLLSLINLNKRGPVQRPEDNFRKEGLKTAPGEISQPPDSLGTVTEQTTRSFEHPHRNSE
ncbi:MAG TPA: zinc ribbon domain-containing protein [Blastocatellia bacterium]|nr:zinc ribbon domain-containing protein [Blastocatellia bacterium]